MSDTKPAQAAGAASEAVKQSSEPAAAQNPAAKAKEDGSPAASTAPEGEKKLTNKELKELKKKQKSEKRAAMKESKGLPAQSEQSKQKQKQNQASSGSGSTAQSSSQQQQQRTINKQVTFFSHLETREQRNELSLSQTQVLDLVHPEILSLTLKYSSYTIVGSIPRCIAMLKAFQKVISDYKTPQNTTLTRNLTNHLGYQIDYLKTVRPLSVTMGNAIRWLKQEISYISIDTNDNEAKSLLIEKIDTFIREKIELSDKLIIKHASNHIQNGSTILTFGNSNVLKELFLYNAKTLNKNFTLIIVDSRPLFEGKKLAKILTMNGLKVQYSLITSITSIFQDVDTVFLGAHAMLSNGFLYSRVGSALIAMTAKNKNIPVLVCCESIKFSDRVQLDSVTYNELGDNEDLIDFNQLNNVKKSSVALKNFIKSHEVEENKNQQQAKNKQQQKEDSKPLKDWEKNQYLDLLNIMYDLTPPEYVQKIITEVGALPPSSVPVILREYKAT